MFILVFGWSWFQLIVKNTCVFSWLTDLTVPRFPYPRWPWKRDFRSTLPCCWRGRLCRTTLRYKYVLLDIMKWNEMNTSELAHAKYIRKGTLMEHASQCSLKQSEKWAVRRRWWYERHTRSTVFFSSSLCARRNSGCSYSMYLTKEPY